MLFSFNRWRVVGLVVAVACWVGGPGASAQTRLGTPFTDHMVFQADAPVRVWGWDQPGASVTVQLGDHSAQATADDGGKWLATLPEIHEVGPYELVVRGSQTLTVRDAVAGEVWWCSGQSNMVWPISKSDGRQWVLKQEANPDIRLMKLPTRSSETPENEAKTQWQISGPDTLPDFSAVAYFFGRRLSGELQRPVGLMQGAWGGSKIRAWVPPAVLEASPHFATLSENRQRQVQRYEEALAQWNANGREGQRPPVAGGGPQHSLSGLANGMTHPVLPYAVRGVLWYQGEADTWEPEMYTDLFADLVGSWREGFQDPELPVFFVQLPNFRKTAERWPAFREAQRQLAQSLNRVDMVVTIDVGDPDDIHPANKKDVGDRLAQLALAQTYGRDIAPGSPRPVRVAADPKDPGRVLVTFDRVAEGLATATPDQPVLGFEIVGQDGEAQPVTDARIVGPETVALVVDAESPPAEVRYAFEPDPKVNLVNSKQYPATPFAMSLQASGSAGEPQ